MCVFEMCVLQHAYGSQRTTVEVILLPFIVHHYRDQASKPVISIDCR